MILWRYVHHIIFDPLGAWDKFVADLFWSAAVVILMVSVWLIFMGVCYITFLCKKIAGR
jgi:hypothetical protein